MILEQGDTNHVFWSLLLCPCIMHSVHLMGSMCNKTSGGLGFVLGSADAEKAGRLVMGQCGYRWRRKGVGLHCLWETQKTGSMGGMCMCLGTWILAWQVAYDACMGMHHL
jgi:hypothetical protein